MDEARQRRGPPRLIVWGAAAALMALPILLLRTWEGSLGDVGDYVFLAILITGLGLAYEAAFRIRDALAYRAGAVIALLAGFLHMWINLAVGIIGSEDNPANLIYFAVVAVAVAGSLIARFRPAGMAIAMGATALVQLLTFVVALIGGLGFTGPITIFFGGLWLISGWLFRRAAETPREQSA